jgi:ABC-type glycerol-3-phosphate transport system substrate-binding protein
MIMTRTVFAMAVAALLFAAVSGTSQAAPIAPLTGVTSGDTGSVTPVYYYHRGYYHRHWRRCYWHNGYRRCW